MSQENALQFLALAEQTPSLQAKLDAITPATAEADIRALALAHGLDFTFAELSQALTAPAGPLDEASLARISGGITQDEALRLFREEVARRKKASGQ